MVSNPIEVTNVRYTTAVAEPVSGSGPISKGTVFVAGVIIGAILAGGVSCNDEETESKTNPAVPVSQSTTK